MAVEAFVALGEWLVSDTVVAGVAAGAAGAAASYAMAPDAPSLPQIEPPKPMPDQRAIDSARKRSIQQQMSRRGRASTILTDDSGGGDTLG